MSIWEEAKRFHDEQNKLVEGKPHDELAEIQRQNSEKVVQFQKRVLADKASGKLKD